ncbi:MAG: nuclear transport factor 2 family protein [Alcanivorax sp.]|nr:nuclear transport factor 2 family protein [Alcanivorax sp.]
MTHEDMKQARERWYAAYFAGDVGHLSRVQADNFTVTTEHGVQSRESQLDAIYSARSNGRWFSQGAEKQDTELAFEDSDGSTRVTGKGFTVSGQVEGPVVAFSETWEWDGANWRVVSLHYGAIRNLN